MGSPLSYFEGFASTNNRPNLNWTHVFLRPTSWEMPLLILKFWVVHHQMSRPCRTNKITSIIPIKHRYCSKLKILENEDDDNDNLDAITEGAKYLTHKATQLWFCWGYGFYIGIQTVYLVTQVPGSCSNYCIYVEKRTAENPRENAKSSYKSEWHLKSNLSSFTVSYS